MNSKIFSTYNNNNNLENFCHKFNSAYATLMYLRYSTSTFKTSRKRDLLSAAKIISMSFIEIRFDSWISLS